MGRDSRGAILAAEGPSTGCDRRSFRAAPYSSSRTYDPRLVETRPDCLVRLYARVRLLPFCAELEIFAAGFYTFSVVRHLEAVSGAAGGIAARRLGNHDGRLGRRDLRGNRTVDRARGRTLGVVSCQ